MLLCAALMWLLAHLAPGLPTGFPLHHSAAASLALLGITAAFMGVAEFRRARTTVDPTDPGKSSALVTHGIYRLTRNPMYLGFLLLLLAWCVELANLLALAGPVAFQLYMNRFQIEPEERMLEERFGADYVDYRRRVRRWV